MNTAMDRKKETRQKTSEDQGREEGREEGKKEHAALQLNARSGFVNRETRVAFTGQGAMQSRMVRRSLPAVVLACAAVFSTLPATAHDFWIEPGSFHAVVGVRLPVTLRVGEEFKGDSVPYVPDRIVDFSVSSAAGRESVTGRFGDVPAATLVFSTPGLRIIGYHSKRSIANLAPNLFDEYLQAEGLERIHELRRERDQGQVNGREYYSRCSKSLISVGSGMRPTSEPVVDGAAYDRELGYPVEMILKANPYSLGPGDTLPIVVHYLGKPLAGLLVIAFTANEPTQKFQARTGLDGTVTVPLARAGRWLIKAVHMIEVPAGDPAADWESFWASLTFDVAPGGDARSPVE